MIMGHVRTQITDPMSQVHSESLRFLFLRTTGDWKSGLEKDSTTKEVLGRRIKEDLERLF